MANISRVNGFRPVKHLDGSPYNGQVNKYWVAAGDGTALFVGDIVKLSGTSDTDGNASVIQVAAGNTPVGVLPAATWITDALPSVSEVPLNLTISPTKSAVPSPAATQYLFTCPL